MILQSEAPVTQLPKNSSWFDEGVMRKKQTPPYVGWVGMVRATGGHGTTHAAHGTNKRHAMTHESTMDSDSTSRRNV